MRGPVGDDATNLAVQRLVRHARVLIMIGYIDRSIRMMEWGGRVNRETGGAEEGKVEGVWCVLMGRIVRVVKVGMEVNKRQIDREKKKRTNKLSVCLSR